MRKDLIVLAVLIGAFLFFAFVIPLPLTAPERSEDEVPGEPYAATAMVSAELYLEAKTLGVSVTPLEVIEDSRCPAEVECIRAGTVRLKVYLKSALAESTVVMALGDSVITETEKVEFIDAEPPPRAGSAISPTDYVFNFKISKKVGGEF